MKTPKLLKKVQEFVESDKVKQCKRRDCIKEVLQKLKKKQHMLEAQIAKEKGEKERKNIQKTLDAVYAQRKKGLKALKSVKK